MNRYTAQSCCHGGKKELNAPLLSSETRLDHRRCTYTRPGIRGVRFSVILVGSSTESRERGGVVQIAFATFVVAWMWMG